MPPEPAAPAAPEPPGPSGLPTFPELPGRPSDDVPAILAEGRSGVDVLFVSLSARHPEGRDREYLRWHTYDHRPEQHRLPGVRQSLRLVSTPACRAARAVTGTAYDAVDHVMTYWFRDVDALQGFADLSVALGEAGRKPELLPMVERGAYRVVGRHAAPRIKAGADVLPWWPLRGMYVLLERGGTPFAEVVGEPGVAGVWWAAAEHVEVVGSVVDPALRITCCFLDDEPEAVARRLAPVLATRWSAQGAEPLLAAAFHPVTGPEFDRHLP